MKTKTQCLLLAAALFAALHAAGQTSGATANAQLKMLFQLQGYWQSPKTIMQTGDKEYTFGYSADFKSVSENSGLMMNELAEIPALGKLNGTNLIGVNPNDGKIHWFSVDNMGTTHEHVGEFTDERHFSMTFKGTQEGKEYIENIMLEFTGKDVMNLKLVETLGGKEITAIKGTFYRKTAG